MNSLLHRIRLPRARTIFRRSLLAALLLTPLVTLALRTETLATTVRSLDGPGWRIATDPSNEGRAAKWFVAPRKEAKPTKVPWIIQEPFPGFHGVAWYWREFSAPTNPHAGGRYLLRNLLNYAADRSKSAPPAPAPIN